MDLRTLLKDGDLLTFANGKKSVVGLYTRSILLSYYDEDLKCETNPEYSIIQVDRPTYQTIFNLKNQNEVHTKRIVR